MLADAIQHADDVKRSGQRSFLEQIKRELTKVLGPLTVTKVPFSKCVVSRRRLSNNDYFLDQDEYQKDRHTILHPSRTGLKEQDAALTHVIPLYWSLLGALA